MEKSRARLALIVLSALAAASPSLAQSAAISARARALSVQNNPALASEDPLTRQILRQVTQPTGSVKTFVRVASGQSIELKSVELELEPLSGARGAGSAASSRDPRSGLSVAPGLLPRQQRAAGRNGRDIKDARAQLRKVDRQGHWGGGKPGPAQP